MGDKTYALEGKKDTIQNFGGGNATVTGRLSGGTLEVTAIGPEIRDAQTKSR
jgi:hypothetical protein